MNRWMITGFLLVATMASLAQAGEAWYVKKATWQDSLVSSLTAIEKDIADRKNRKAPPFRPVRTKEITTKTLPQTITVDITGQRFLSLKAEPGQAHREDHACWANAKLITKDGKTVWLDTLTPEYVKVGWGRFAAGKMKVKGRDSMSPSKLGTGKTLYDRFIYAHAPSTIVYRLDPKMKFKTFQAVVGIQIRPRRRNRGSVVFVVGNREVVTPKNYDSLWSRLFKDFPTKTTKLLAAKEWLKRDGLTLFTTAAAYTPKARETLVQAAKTLAYVEKSAKRPAMAAKLKAENARAKVKKPKNPRQLWLDAHMLRRDIILSHPALDFEKILVNLNPPTTYSHNGDQHLGRHSRSGPGLSIVTDWKTGDAKATPFLKGKLPVGATRNPDLHFDAEKVVFGFCDYENPEGLANRNHRRYFLYEAALDGSWVRQLTGTPRDSLKTWDNRATVLIEDNDPCYMPDGNIMFISTRGQSYGRCHSGRYVPAFVLYRCDAKGDKIKQISFANENEYEPAVLNDGSIVFTRWEYTNRHEMFFHMLWQCRPDGTNVTHYYGNDTITPMMVTESTAIPGTNKIVATAMGHHSYSTGTTILLDVTKGENGEAPVTHITPETPYSESHGWPEPHYSHPYPINEELYLASRANHRVPSQGKHVPANGRGIYLIDHVTGGREMIFEDPEIATFSPIAIRKRVRPPVIPAMTPPNAPKEATLFLQNIYLTRNDPEGKIKPGAIKYLRVNALGVQPRNRNAGVSRYVGVEIPKKVIGTVPIGPDGSAVMTVPAELSLQMQALDKNGMAILTEKSLFYLQPGERRSCVGCHEPVGMTPDPQALAKIIRKQPVKLTPPAGPQYSGGMSFMRSVQPVLDRYCIRCHGLKSGRATKKTNLIHDGNHRWPRSYLEMAKRGKHDLGLKPARSTREGYISRPYEYYSQENKVAKLILRNHGKTNMDRDSRWRIFQWMDLNAQCYGDMYPNKLEWRKINQPALAKLRAYIKTQFGKEGAILAAQPERALINVAQIDESRILQAPLALKAGGWGQIKGAWASKNDPGYKKMAALVDACVEKKPSDNVTGWTPNAQQGGSEGWVAKQREALRKAHAAEKKLQKKSK